MEDRHLVSLNFLLMYSEVTFQQAVQGIVLFVAFRKTLDVAERSTARKGRMTEERRDTLPRYVPTGPLTVHVTSGNLGKKSYLAIIVLNL